MEPEVVDVLTHTKKNIALVMTIAEAGKKAKSLILAPVFRSQALEKECMKYKLLLANLLHPSNSIRTCVIYTNLCMPPRIKPILPWSS